MSRRGASGWGGIVGRCRRVGSGGRILTVGSEGLSTAPSLKNPRLSSGIATTPHASPPSVRTAAIPVSVLESIEVLASKYHAYARRIRRGDLDAASAARRQRHDVLDTTTLR